ncbi:MAG TPA: hypothetical protein VI932_07085 [Bacteroidota bacterium]|nr:hypothetical protein [Bacteroidota bacterium]
MMRVLKRFRRSIGGACARTPLAACFAVICAGAYGTTLAQVNVSGQASTAVLKSRQAVSQYTFNKGRASFAWRADLFFDAEIAENILFLSNVRLAQDEDLHVDLFTIRFTELAGPSLNAEAGLIDVPFGNIGERRFPRTNPFISLPLGREHITTLRASDYELWMSDSRYTAAGNGVRLIDGALYDAGLKVFGTVGILDYAVAVTNGMVSSTGSYAPGGLNDNHGLGKAARVALTPVTGFTIGLSAARGPFMAEGASSYYGTTYAGGRDASIHVQEIAGLDLEYGYGYFTFYGEGFLNRWEFSDEYGEDLEAAGFSAELRFVPAARFSLAARVGAISFNELPGEGDPGYYGTIPGTPWDRDILRIEGAVGYRISRQVLVKGVYQHVNTVGLNDDPADDTAALQIVASF